MNALRRSLFLVCGDSRPLPVCLGGFIAIYAHLRPHVLMQHKLIRKLERTLNRTSKAIILEAAILQKYKPSNAAHGTAQIHLLFWATAEGVDTVVQRPDNSEVISPALPSIRGCCLDRWRCYFLCD